MEDSRTSPAERLLQAAVALCMEQGLSALTARTLAERSGFAASAMTYHFGDRATLVARVLDQVIRTLAAWRAEWTDGRADAPPWMSTPAAIVQTLEDLLSRQRPWCILLAELEADSRLTGEAVGARFVAEAGDMRRFWCDLAVRHGARPAAAEVWSNLAQGLSAELLAEPEPSIRLAWCMDAAFRLDQRLRRLPPVLSPSAEHDPDIRLLAMHPPPEGAQRILDAALQVIGDRGVARLTLRDVAAAAGVSLASTTYYFRSRTDLIHAAFLELHRRIRANVLESAARDGAFGAQSGVTDEEGRLGRKVSALEALGPAAARDPALLRLARDLRSTRGATSLPILRARGIGDADSLDAFIWSVSMSVALKATRQLPLDQRTDALARAGDAALAAIFGLSSKPASHP